MPQFANADVFRCQSAHFVVGVAIFARGLFKKVILADGMALYAYLVFVPADHNQVLPSQHEAWRGAVAYTFQIYSDFSGYPDMTIGFLWIWFCGCSLFRLPI